MGRLFHLHGPPLVFKSDNGSPFIAEQTRQCCRLHQVANLLSPPLTPQYHGSVEATGGTLKTRAAQLAMHNGCDTWSRDILEASRLAANALNRPWGAKAPTPDERWHARAPMTPQQRSALQTLVAHKTLDLTQSIQRERFEKALDQRMTGAGFASPANDRATVARVAIRQALVELGHLHIRRPTPTMSTQSNAVSSEN